MEVTMKKRMTAFLLVLALALTLCACAKKAEDGEEFKKVDGETDFSAITDPEDMEKEFTYKGYFLPAAYGPIQAYVGDTMPYYEDGTYYIYYLKQGADSYNHSIYLTQTTDFVNYTETEDVIIESNYDGGQDGWVGTGSVVKVGGRYLFFYTGHHSSDYAEYKEKILVAEGTSLTSFTKKTDWELIPPEELGQKNDFRDPQAYVDEATGNIILTVTASQGGVARILKFTLSADLSSATYDGVIFTDPTGRFWNLECSDTFKLGDKYYITYSGQDDTLWYAMSDVPYGPYGDAYRLDGKLFYAAKHVEGKDGTYMVGWARRSEYADDTERVVAWAGNMAVQRLCQNADGTLYLAPADSIAAQYTVRRELNIDSMSATIASGSKYSYTDVFTAYESFMLKGSFKFDGNGDFGLAFDYNGEKESYKLITLSPSEGTLSLSFNEGLTPVTETPAALEKGREYTFTYIQEGSVGTFYVDGVAALTVRLYGVAGKPVRLFCGENTVEFTGLKEYTR